MDHYFLHTLAEASDAFNATMKDFGYTQHFEAFDPTTHHYHVPQQRPLYG